ncbi:PorV/PorQ family protein [bacterium]|nr:MAG: PorV/PorQ family protein [bacterium]
MSGSLLSAAFFLFLGPSAYAAGPGTSAATFLNLGFGARPLALGESFVAVADDVSAVHYNPAGLAFAPSLASRQSQRRYEMLASHAMHIQDIRLSQFGFLARPWGFSLTHLSLDGIERRTSETLQPEGSFGASDLLFGVSYGRRLVDYGVGLGASGKYIKQSIGEYSASAYALDLGALYRLQSAPVSLGASVVNLGTRVKFVDQAYPLPLTLRLGAAYGMTARFPHALTIQLDLPRDNAPNVRLGMEYLGFGPFALRAGYRTTSAAQRSAALGKALGSSAPGLAEFYGMFMGAGFRSKYGSMDYTLLPYGELGNAHRFSFTVRFGGPNSFPLVETHPAGETLAGVAP